MKSLGFYISILAVIIGLTAIYLSLGQTDTVMYVSSPRLFEEFTGTKELSRRLDNMRIYQKQQIDSLEQLAASYQQEEKLQRYGTTVSQLREAEQLFAEENQMRSNEFTKQIWKQLNQYTQEYGEEQGYEYILGANSNGSIMFAKASKDITDEVIEYANRKYNGLD